MLNIKLRGEINPVGLFTVCGVSVFSTGGVGCLEYFVEITCFYNYKLNKLTVQWNAFLLNGVLKLY